MAKVSLSALMSKLESARKAGPGKPGVAPGAARATAIAAGSASPPRDATVPPPLGACSQSTPGAVSVVAAPAGGNPSPPPLAGAVSNNRINQEAHIRARKLFLNTFVRHFLTPGPAFMNAAAAWRAVRPDQSQKIAANEAWKLMQMEDCKEEIERQLRAIDKAADMDDQWVYDRWRAIANANLFDYATAQGDGRLVFDKLDPLHLTLEQQLVIRQVKLDKHGRVIDIKLADPNRAVENVARARQMIDGNRDLGMVDLADRITQRMNKAAKRIGRTFDSETGEQVG